MRKLLVLSFAIYAAFANYIKEENSKKFMTNVQVNNDVDKVNNGGR